MSPPSETVEDGGMFCMLFTSTFFWLLFPRNGVKCINKNDSERGLISRKKEKKRKKKTLQLTD